VRAVVRQRWQYVIAGAAAAAVLALAVAALAGRDPAPEPAGAAGSPVPVVVPGRPGETAAVVPSDQLQAPDGSQYNASDVWFVRMMIPHHAQALEMAALAPQRAGSPQVRAFAERVSTAQGPEIAVLRAWLDARDLPETDPAHPHDQMPGMQPPEAIEALAAATGDAFDALFVELMSDHHQGAVDMATGVLGTGADERILELAGNIAVEQSVEIDRMRELLAR
jgi:uncharacterized protein (DUF305 family)